jgi:hypothetical protein
MQMYYFHASFNNSKLKSQKSKTFVHILNFEFLLFNLYQLILFIFTQMNFQTFNQFIQ